MSRESFNQQWTLQPKVSIFTRLFRDDEHAVVVDLPHDAMLGLARTPDSPGGSGAAYFPGGTVQYIKALDVPEEWRDQRLTLEFQGVYRDAMVFVNGALAGQRPNGYATFHVPLDPYLRYGASNEIRVEARAHDDSRWYSGLGIHRDVVLIRGGLIHLDPVGPRVTVHDVDDEAATVDVAVAVWNESHSTEIPRLEARVFAPDGAEVARGSVPVTVRPGDRQVTRQRLTIDAPQRWGVDHPHLYRVELRLALGEREMDEASAEFGIRTLQLDPRRGLRINGEPVTLRGACIHHDNGILGAAAHAGAEERRVRLLKEAGFNAIRAAHNPLSQAMLVACDRLGVLVMDEAFDMWAEAKNNFDYSTAFPEWWERDIEAMVAKDFNHPSVIIYSIGNEILDAGKPSGGVWGRALAEKVRSLDPTRYVTNGVSGFVATITELLGSFREQAGEIRAQGNVNDLMADLHHLMGDISMSSRVTDLIEETHSVVDLVGHNYGHDRYESDLARFPNRVVVGTESLARKIDAIWALVTANPHVIGDFTWTGWDYLGEAGIGRVDHVPEGETPPGPDYPWLLAWCGDIDITGYRRPASYYREIVFGLRSEPYIAVNRPAPEGTHPSSLDWSWTDSLGSWTFDVPRGTPMTVEVYSDAPEVELLLNGESVGVAPAGPQHRFRARFTVGYAPGEVVAIARRDGADQGRTSLRSAAGATRVRLSADRPSVSPEGLCFVEIELTDDAATLATAWDTEVAVRVEGPGELIALGSANPVQEAHFERSSCRTFEGRALAVVRPTGTGTMRIGASASGVSEHAVGVSVVEGERR